MNIIFVCTGNTCRSPMAEAIAKDVFAKKGVDAEVISRGIAVGGSESASENSKITMEEMGLSLDGFIPRQIDINDILWTDLVITMTESHKAYLAPVCNELNKELYTLSEAAGEKGEIGDPYGGRIEDYRECAEYIKKYIDIIAEKLA